MNYKDDKTLIPKCLDCLREGIERPLNENEMRGWVNNRVGLEPRCLKHYKEDRRLRFAAKGFDL